MVTEKKKAITLSDWITGRLDRIKVISARFAGYIYIKRIPGATKHYGDTSVEPIVGYPT